MKRIYLNRYSCNRIVSANINANLSTIQNTLGKYLYNNLEGSYSLKRTSTGCEVLSTILYQIPDDVRKTYKDVITDESADVHEMNVEINITTYADKVRVNVISTGESEQNVMTRSFKAALFDDMQAGLEFVHASIVSSIQKKFKGYEILL